MKVMKINSLQGNCNSEQHHNYLCDIVLAMGSPQREYLGVAVTERLTSLITSLLRRRFGGMSTYLAKLQ
jgi:hypothetical protein